jgi:cardiolipin synthase
VHLFELVPSWRLRIAWFRRLHRKLIVVDGACAFVGGINFSAMQLADGDARDGDRPLTKQDYAVEVRGPVVADVHALAADTAYGRRRAFGRRARRRPADGTPAGSMTAAFVARDNQRQRTAIERHYRLAIAGARRRVIIANAYFLPGYRLLRALRHAARRGVDVRLVLQGQPDMPLVQMGARVLYGPLLEAGVHIHEYCRRPFHGKVAVIDEDWATVGSSNLDPLSLALNLEANIIVRNRPFASDVASRLERLIASDCTLVTLESPNGGGVWRPALGTLLYHVLRHVPQWSGWLPAHAPRLTGVPSAGRRPTGGQTA